MEAAEWRLLLAGDADGCFNWCSGLPPDGQVLVDLPWLVNDSLMIDLIVKPWPFDSWLMRLCSWFMMAKRYKSYSNYFWPTWFIMVSLIQQQWCKLDRLYSDCYPSVDGRQCLVVLVVVVFRYMHVLFYFLLVILIPGIMNAARFLLRMGTPRMREPNTKPN